MGDRKHQGVITYDELRKVMEDKYHLPPHEVKAAFQALDTHHDKEIHFSDFLAAMVSTCIELHEELVHEAFRKFDTNDLGYLTVDSLREVLRDSFEGQAVESLFNEANTLHSGAMS